MSVQPKCANYRTDMHPLTNYAREGTSVIEVIRTTLNYHMSRSVPTMSELSKRRVDGSSLIMFCVLDRANLQKSLPVMIGRGKADKEKNQV